MENKTKNSFSFGEFVIDPSRRLLFKRGEIVSLNPKALDLLLTLLENRGRVVSKNELLDKVWENQFVEENNLTVHIAALRKALGEKKNEHRYIVTVPGKGYNFVAQVQTIGEEAKAVRDNGKLPVENSVSGDIPNANHSVVRTETPGDFLLALSKNFDDGESLIGREREIAEVKNLLRGDSANSVTLTGTGGTGKTRLARAVADDLSADFADGVFFVELAAISNAELVVPAIAQTLGLKEESGISLMQALKKFLREQRILLVLDNFEQLISAAPLIQELLI
ncbi:MAG TPA: winged helix-turn-helix domain-containing protein, partial [Pyrinomonadaceae bacterium]|nr:winged helix-turn-helix domain-containing protein [Pyrinomonadaceae bacterium]